MGIDISCYSYAGMSHVLGDDIHLDPRFPGGRSVLMAQAVRRKVSYPNPFHHLLEGSLVGPLGLVGVAVAGAGNPATLHNDVVPVDRRSGYEIDQAVADSIGVPLLGF